MRQAGCWKVWLLAGVVAIGYGCSSAKMAYKKGEKNFYKGDYEVAISNFETAASKNYATSTAHFLIGESFRLSNRAKMSESYYKKAIELNYKDPIVHYNYGFALKANEKYDEARTQFQTYLEDGDSTQLLKRAEKEVNNLLELAIIREQPGYYRVKNLELINSEQPEYGPYYKDGQLFYTSTSTDAKTYLANGIGYTDIYRVDTEGARVKIETMEALGPEVNSPIRNEGTIVYSPDGNMMIFAKGNSRKKKGGLEVSLYVSVLRNEQWSEPRPLSLNNTKVPSWNSTPCFSKDGKTLYFASNRPGGYGGVDIYSAQRTRRGDFVRVRNMGKVINTPGNEMFPHVSDDGRMYFASDGHAGFGGLDLFVAERRSGRITVENLGGTINSSSDDFGFYLFSPTRGFFSSNREGGKGDDDIYTFVNNDPNLKIINYFLSGITYEHQDDGSTKILPNTRVQLFGENGDLLEETTTGANGKYNFRVYGDEDYILIAEKTSYLNKRAAFTTKGKTIPKERLIQLVTNKVFETDIILDKLVENKIYQLTNIYYDLDEDYIRPDAALVLDSLVTILEDNPGVTIELSSHTDSRAADDYNMDLSQRRAQSAVNYLISKGIPTERLVARGYGETQLKNRCSNEVNCTEEEHQQNRRTEFKVLAVENNRRSVPIEEEVVEPEDLPDTPADADDGDSDVFDEDKYFKD